MSLGWPLTKSGGRRRVFPPAGGGVRSPGWRRSPGLAGGRVRFPRRVAGCVPPAGSGVPGLAAAFPRSGGRQRAFPPAGSGVRSPGRRRVFPRLAASPSRCVAPAAQQVPVDQIQIQPVFVVAPPPLPRIRWTQVVTMSLTSLAGFNVDVTQTWVTSKDEPFVLSTLLHQDSSTNQTWLLVTSPGTSGSAGPLHRCSRNLDKILCQPVEFPIPKRRHKGVAVARNQHGVLVCIQLTTRQPHSLNPAFTGTCSLLAPNLKFQLQTNFSDLENHLNQNVRVAEGNCYINKESSMERNKNSARQRRALEDVEEAEEDEAGTEIAIILDGSGSIDPPDFQRAKDFISNMMRDIYEKCFECNFALVQYGAEIRTEFDLLDSQDVMASLARVQNITQVGNVTKTASAMQHVLDNIFTPSRGSRKKASKVMVVLTDGDVFMDPLNLTTVISSPKMKDVERFSIGVGEKLSDKELKLIASDPDETHAFKVTNYSSLDGLLGRLQQSIIRMEGAAGDALHYQLAQVGFSAQILDERQVLLGAIGAFDWSGGALLYDMCSYEGQFLKQKALHDKAVHYSYLGYSLAVLNKTNGLFFVSGAPQYKNRGAVFEFQKGGTESSFLPVLEGEQMGSYFGSELCSVDVDMDGTTDVLLVAAPFFYTDREEGKVYMYCLNKENGSFSPATILNSNSKVTDARFGFAMATIGDINQDGLIDVAIGAPIEDFDDDDDGASFGSVYIYNGRPDGLSIHPSQRIRASEVHLGLHYFGMSLAGGFDFSGDGLDDVTVGTLGQAIVLRSRPVVHLKVSMTFSPDLLPIDFKGTVNVNLCFEISSGTTVIETGLRDTALNFTLDLDVTKQRKRLECLDVKSCVSIFKKWISGSHLCEPLQFHPTKGEQFEDYYSNISIKVSYQLQTPAARRDYPYPILDFYSEPSAFFQLPYEKACKNKLFCVPDLKLDTSISEKVLVVGDTKELTMNVMVTNAGEDSYMTELTLEYPRNLQFKRIQEPPSLNIQCEDPQPAAASVLAMNCKIGHPIFKRSSADILVVWQIEENAFPNRTMDITVMVNSTNAKSPVSKNETLQVKHAFTAVLSKPPVMYMNTNQRPHHKDFFFSIHGENLFGARFQLKICVPVKIHGLQVLTVKNVTKAQDDEELMVIEEVRPVIGRALGGVIVIPGSEEQGRTDGHEEGKFLPPPDASSSGMPLAASDSIRTSCTGRRAVALVFLVFDKPAPPSLSPTSPLLLQASLRVFPVAPNSEFSESITWKRADLSAALVSLPPLAAAFLVQGGDAGSGQRASPGTLEAGSIVAEPPTQMTSSPGVAGAVGLGLRGDVGALNREALVPCSSASPRWLHTLRSGLRRPGLQSGKGGGPRGLHGVLHFCGGRARSLRCLGVTTRLGRSLGIRLQGRLRRGRTGLPRKSGSSESSETTDSEGQLLLALLLLLLLNRCFRSCGENHCAAARPGHGRGPQLATGPVQMQTPRDFRETCARLRPARQPASPPGPSASAQRSGKLGAGVGCSTSQRHDCRIDRGQHVEEWYSASCDITSNKENITVAAEFSGHHEQQLLLDIGELQIFGEITFDESLYVWLNAENHKTKSTIIFLNDQAFLSLSTVIGSSVGGLLVLIVIIVILMKCGFFKRKYKKLNLESMRRAQQSSSDKSVEEYKD
ncbi:PREDICTED: integrin alpha-E [Elephantulus edwardii]|uniref:integrin alpha-E n=1 Tax=Elephantulus edwardii TaxID=28737 RepID=UPI0003F09770|nr:PREDICTED: integrin alpha-E [Elephantulus edwardii]